MTLPTAFTLPNFIPTCWMPYLINCGVT